MHNVNRLLRVALATLGAVLPFLTAPSAALAQGNVLPSPAPNVAGSLAALGNSLPSEATGYTNECVAAFRAASQRVDNAVSNLARYDNARQPADVLPVARQLLDAHRRVDLLLDESLARRREFAKLAAGPGRRELIRNYLLVTSGMIDLTGRLRYQLYDGLDVAAYRVAASPVHREQLVNLAAEFKSGIGAAILAILLYDPPAEVAARVRPASTVLRAKLLRLIAESRSTDMVPVLVRYLRRGRPNALLTVMTVDTIRQLGYSQDPLPGEEIPEEDRTARSPMYAAEMHEILKKVNTSQLRSDWAQRHAFLLRTIGERIEKGITGDTFRLGDADLKPGDWLLMRNPSPYNLFTDLSPGLFTHVGVVTDLTPKDGVRRIVLVDLPEKGKQIPATNVEAFVPRTRHYVFLRHPDPNVQERMADAARQMIGNDVQFDLNFRTDRVLELAHSSLADRKIHTYCAGFLLLCALQTNAPREQFFPVPEYPAGGKTLANLKQFGLSIGKNLVSPTGALFSDRLQLVGRREPMFDPRRQIEESIFDHFALGLEQKQIHPPADLFKVLRLNLAELSTARPWLKQALADAANVSQDQDLVSAAKAAAVVETLDEIAFGASGDFLAARESILAGPESQLASRGLKDADLERVRKMRKRHAELYERLVAGRLSPRELRVELVNYYVQTGKRQIDEQFFDAAPRRSE